MINSSLETRGRATDFEYHSLILGKNQSGAGTFVTNLLYSLRDEGAHVRVLPELTRFSANMGLQLPGVLAALM